jgi:hypothetical protein
MASTQTGDSTAEQVKERAQAATQQASEQARGRVRDEVDRRSTEAGEQATTVAEAIRQSAQHLREQGNAQAAKPIEQAADRVERAGHWLRDSDGDRILRDVEDFGRRNPLAVVAGGLAAGFALSRLLKASSSERYHGGSPGSGGDRRAALPRPTTMPPRQGVMVPDLPAPPTRTPTPPPPGPATPGAPGVTGGPGAL